LAAVTGAAVALLGGGTALAAPSQAGCANRTNNTYDKLLECVRVEGVREHQAALQAIADLNGAGLYFKSIPKEVRPAFIAGSLPIMQGSIASLGGVTTDATFKFSVHSFPKFPDKQRLMNSGGSFIGVYARDDDQKKATWDFIKYVISQEGMEIWMKTGYLNSTTFEIPQLPGQEAAYEQLNEGITRETAWPGSRGAEMQHVWEESCDQMFAGDVSVADGVQQAKEEMSDLM